MRSIQFATWLIKARQQLEVYLIRRSRPGSGLADVTPGNSESPRTTSTDWAQSVPTQQDERRFGPDSKLEGLKPARCVHQQSRLPRASPRTSRHRPITPLGQENC
ncbi:hypothetical protein Pst134EA_015764 [Puccinia striiformis f. sp. tritici]|uniref:Uncharacterized protein n=2 Tax=Puccinia striiformis TaxID=27350 RepID=A0A2S4VFU4_9BASI|nr:hypothetical protein Pst134EA_015764 [Puccinia striiformis f. sp. tritici]KAH9463679.1 hypothetical protein Pst134EA_015764 [Puccinia striiformis f. sp. tritici]POV95766.1 hypothetical protein PSTT_16049 [Puccinia striiformis]POW08377.1 hypothetical protein PSHT_09587 [Puccinia striiformis]